MLTVVKHSGILQTELAGGKMQFFKGLVVLLLLLSASHCVLGQEIMSIAVQGNTNTEAYFIVSSSGLTEGVELDPTGLRGAVKRIYRLGLFEDVTVDTTLVPGGVDLTIVVTEYPTVSAVRYLGNRKISDKDLEEKVSVLEGEIISPQRVLRWKRRILDAYEEKGYLLAEVSAEQVPEGEGESRINFVIDEGKRVRIREVRIQGNEQYSDSEIEIQMTNREKTWYRSASFKEDEFDADLEKVVEFYKREGYADCQVVEHEITYDTLQEWMSIAITVEEGKRYRMGDATFKGNEVFPTVFLVGLLKYEPGDIYNSERLDNTLMEIYSAFGEDGYIYATVTPNESVRNDTLIDVEYEITENNQAYVRKVEIEGNSKTREKVIRREIDILPGDVFKRSRLVRSQRAVFNLGFFEDVTIDSRTANEKGDIDLVFNVQEKATGQIGMGLAYSEVDRLTGYLTLSLPNLLGRGESSYIRVEKGGTKQNLEIGFTEPWFLDMPLTVGFDLFHLTREREGYDDKRVGGAVNASRPMPGLDYTRVYWTYRLEEREINIQNEDEVGSYILDQEGRKTASTTRVALVRDTRDSFFNSTIGTRNLISGEWAGGYLGGQIKYHKYEAETRWYHPLLWNNVLMIRARGGFVDGYSEGEAVPISERFFVGGVGDWGIRGYGDWGTDIGPRDSFGNPLGGRTALVLNVEYKVPLTSGVYALAFADAGNVWESFSDIEIDSRDDLKRGAGVGIRIEIPMMGVMGFDFGYGFDRRDPGWVPHFQIGTAF
jgi:outer membrane protein insertion porin family